MTDKCRQLWDELGKNSYTHRESAMSDSFSLEKSEGIGCVVGAVTALKKSSFCCSDKFLVTVSGKHPSTQ